MNTYRKLVEKSNTLQITRALTFVGLLLAGAHTQAAWVIEPSASLRASFDDNIQNSSNNEDDGIVTTLNGQARIRNQTDLSDVSILGGVDFSQYSGADRFEDNEQRETLFLEARAERRLKRSQLRFSSSVRRQDLLRNFRVIDTTTAVSELEDEATAGFEPDVADDLITGGDVDLGSAQQLVQRDIVRINPSTSYQLSERTSVSLNYGYIERSYDDDRQGSPFRDSESQTASLGMQRLLSPTDTLRLSFEASRFDADFQPESDSYSVTFDWRRILSEKLRLSLSVGSRKTKSDFFEDSGGLFTLRLDRQTFDGRLFAIASRNLAATGYGDQVESDRLSFGYTAKISDRLGWDIRFRAFRTERISDFQEDRSRDFLSVAPSVRWAITPILFMRLSYEYQWIDRNTDDDSAVGNRVGLALEYVPDRRK